MSEIGAVFFPPSNEEFFQTVLTIVNNGEINIITNDAGKFMMYSVLNKAELFFV